MIREGYLVAHRLRSVMNLLRIYLRMLPQLVRSVWKVSRLVQPVVSIFGGSRIALDDPHARMAYELAVRLVARKISVLTGGGPGIMRAANCGAVREADQNLRSMGIGIKGISDIEAVNQCAQDVIITDYLTVRKFLLTQYSQAYVIFPGGYGTLDELAEIATLIQTGLMEVRPIILVSRAYWKNLILWVDDATTAKNIWSERDKLVTLCDTIEEIEEVLYNYLADHMNPHL